MLFIVTFKFGNMKGHDPRRKVTGACRLSENGVCTDVTGGHHSMLVKADSMGEAREKVAGTFHVTRIEEATWWA